MSIWFNEWVTDSTIGDRLAHYRRLAGLSAQQLSDKTGGKISRGVIANIESGRRDDMTVRELLDLCFVLQVPPVAMAFDLQEPYGRVELAGEDDLHASALINWFNAEPETASRGRANPAKSAAWALIEAHREASEAMSNYSSLLRNNPTGQDDAELRRERVRIEKALARLASQGVDVSSMRSWMKTFGDPAFWGPDQDG